MHFAWTSSSAVSPLAILARRPLTAPSCFLQPASRSANPPAMMLSPVSENTRRKRLRIDKRPEVMELWEAFERCG